MTSWASCNLEEEILHILETDSPVTLRYLCAIIFPSMPWCTALLHTAAAVRSHCRFLVEQRLLREIGPDQYALLQMGSA